MFPFLKKIREARRPRCAALVAAAGSSSRMGGVNKLLEPLDGIPVLARTLTALQLAEQVDEIVVATREEDLVEISRLCQTYGITKCTKVIRGGESRAHSVLLAALEVSSETELLAVQDGARPLVTPELIDRVITAAARCDAAAPAVPVKDTVKVAGPDGLVQATPKRSTLYAVQTPQCFDRAAYLTAAQTLGQQDVTDDCQLMELTGQLVKLTEGSYENYKITTIEDLKGAGAMRIGHGYDVHKLVEGRRLILGGVDVPYEKGLLGHSDADVLAHAVMDALLGAAAMGDIGQHFPDNDPAYAGADSLALMKEVARLLAQQGWRVENVDATILCQAPKLAGHIPAMRTNLAAALGLDVSAVSVKATTEEHLGFTGQGLGIAAHAVALIDR